ncbi:MAG: hypothetical protein WC509_07275 [Candidatus Izemoplasmatales bacterium]
MDDIRFNKITKLLNEREYEAAKVFDEDARKNVEFQAAVADLERIDQDLRTLNGLCTTYDFIEEFRSTWDQQFASRMTSARERAVSKLK